MLSDWRFFVAHVVVVDENPASSQVIQQLLGPDHRVHQWEQPTPDSDAEISPDVIILSLDQKNTDGMSLLAELSTRSAGTPVVALLEHVETPRIVDAIHRGASDVVTHPIRTRELQRAITRALARKEAMCLSIPQQASVVPEIVGVSSQAVRLRKLVQKVAPSTAPVLVTGESGVGKELVARALHRLSTRGRGPFEVRNCGAIPESLLESELFGTEKGAYTDAVRRAGAFELASGGTLFLDEIGELSVPAQAKLLRALESHRFRRVGGTSMLATSARFVAATNRNLREGISRREFRDDLYYRINVIRIVVPPLRERVEDIPILVRHFCELLSDAEPEEAVPAFSPGALERLASYDWPGNIRELRNVVWRALVNSTGLIVRAEDLDFA
jgi:DNA-binding NtrC family response regulator